MFCKNCGIQIEDQVKFCPSCGTEVNAADGGSQIPQQSIQYPKPIFAIIATILAGVTFVLTFVGLMAFSVVLKIFSIILGVASVIPTIIYLKGFPKLGPEEMKGYEGNKAQTLKGLSLSSFMCLFLAVLLFFVSSFF